jgi:serine/threonine protein kinase
MNGFETLHVGVRPGKRIVTENIVHDMKQYFIIMKPIINADFDRLERNYQAIERNYQAI